MTSLLLIALMLVGSGCKRDPEVIVDVQAPGVIRLNKNEIWTEVWFTSEVPRRHQL